MTKDVKVGGSVSTPYYLAPSAQENYSVNLDEYLDAGDTAITPVATGSTGISTSGANIVDNVLSFNAIAGSEVLSTEVTVTWSTTISGAVGVGVSIPFEIVLPKDIC